MPFKHVALAAFIVLIASPAFAQSSDPCRAIPDNGPSPRWLTFGATFSGDVVYVIDGDSLCVAIGPNPEDDWVEVRLADFMAPEYKERGGAEARAALAKIALQRKAYCVASMRTYDRIAARCRVDGVALGDALRAAGVPEGGNASGIPTVSNIRQSQTVRRSPPGLSCPELRARGGARRGEPGYRPEWDGDNDGIACEPYRSRR